MLRAFSLLAIPCAIALGAQASTFTITPTFDTSIANDPNAAAIEAVINAQIGIYESQFSDPINVGIAFESSNSGLGSTFSLPFRVGYQDFIQHLTADQTTATDLTALSHLPTGTANPVTGSAFMEVKRANLKALGYDMTNFPAAINFHGALVDGIITLNTHLTDVGSPDTTGEVSLAEDVDHEIDEVLGIGSSLDLGFADPQPEDLYRYDANGNRSFTSSTTATAYFSIDGSTLLAQFDNHALGGDYGDWQSNPLPSGVAPRVQDAFATPGAHPTLGVELTALDVLGYDLSTPSAVPEPTSIVLFGSGIAVLAGTLRRKCRK
jgi:hypothetical protein